MGVLSALTLIAYLNSFNVPFVFDDVATVQRNIGVRFGQFNWNLFNGRSLLYLTFAFNYRWAGLNVWSYHVVNMVLHLLNGFLVLLMAEQIFRTLGAELRHARIQAALAASFFLIHPVQTEAVTYISSRSELLSAFFYFCGFLIFIRWPGRRRGFLCSLTVCVFYFFGLSSKETALTLPAVIFLYDFLFLSDGRFRPILSRWRFYITFWAGAPVTIYYLLTRVLSRSVGSQLPGNLSSWHYFLTQLRVMTRYIQIIFFPAGLNLDYDFRPSLSFLDGAVLASAIFLLAILCLGWSLRRRQPVFTFSILWFFVTLSPTSSVVPIADLIFEHRLYLPLAGVCMSFPLLVEFGYTTLRRFMTRPAKSDARLQINQTVNIVCVLLIGLLVWGTYERNKIWQSEETLWADVALKSPLKARVRGNLGSVYQLEQRYDDALREFAAAMQLSQSLAEPERSRIRQTTGTSMAVSYIQMGQFDKAAEVAIPLWKEFPGLPGIGASLAGIALQMRQPQVALTVIDESLKAIAERRWGAGSKQQEEGYLYWNKAEALKVMGSCDEALRFYNIAAKSDPDLHVPACP
jgi:tetratricopeptide (TPR) repeat protein